MLTDAAGVPRDGDHTVRFRIYDVDAGGTPLHDETRTLSIDAGAFTVYLGEATPLLPGVFDGADRWLGITVGNDAEMTPRLAIGSVPYASESRTCELADNATLFAGQPASAFATAGHHHDGRYLPLATTLSCMAGFKMIGLDTTGSVVCGADLDTQYTADPTGGLALASDAFSIAPSGVTTARIANQAVDANKIAFNAVNNSHIVSDAVGAAEIQTDAVGTLEIADNTVGAADIAFGAVGSQEIADGSVGRAELTGTELAVYLRSSWCATNPGELTTQNSFCATAQCSTDPDWFTCTGSCSAPSPSQCPPSLLGYLVAP
jgi:hypothetical protein